MSVLICQYTIYILQYVLLYWVESSNPECQPTKLVFAGGILL